MVTYATRRAAAADLDVICAQREALFLETGRTADLVARFSGPSRAWHAARLCDGRYVGWLTEADGAVIAGVGLVFLDWSPGPSHPDIDRRPLVMNLWVDPVFRGRDLAKALMREVEAECRRRRTPYAVLHASDAGRPLYERMNWRATNEMSLALNLQD